MSGGAVRTVLLAGDAAARGRAHGEALAAGIRVYTDERVRLAGEGGWSGGQAAGEVLALARRMLPAHRDYSPEIYEEMLATAEAAGITAEEAVVVGGFTDFVDAVRALGRPAPEEDDCTAAIVPPNRGGPWFAQTWDMHDTATEHVVLLEVRPTRGPAAQIFSTAGCVGQIGMNEHGICVGINNLAGADGRVGVTWPFVVREVLRQRSVEDALTCILRAPLAGAHNYQLLGPDGRGFNVEAMPSATAVTPLMGEPLVHTNHCLDPGCQAREAPRAGELLASSEERLAVARRMLAGPGDVDHALLVELLREPTAICRRSRAPWHVESSGAVIARPDTREFWVVWGVPADHPFERFEVRRG